VTAPQPARSRLIFAGTPPVAIPALNALVSAGHDIAAVVTRDDAPLGRKRVLTPSPVAKRSSELGIPTIKANRLNIEVTARIAALRPELGVIVAYGGLVREPLLSTPRLGWINLHFSLLPRWRGAAPVQHAIMAGDTATGAAVFRLVPELDAGAVFDVVERDIGADETSGELLEALATDGAALLASTVARLLRGDARAVEQVGEPTLAPKLTIDDAKLRWDEPADAVYNRLRAVTPEPGAFTEIDGDRVKILSARSLAGQPALAPGRLARRDGRILVGTATHPLELLAVQPAGKRAMPAADWWRGLAAAEVVAG